VLMYIFGMFYCGIINIGHGPILQIIGGSGDPIWVTWKDNSCIKTTRVSCSLLEKSTAFLKVSYTYIIYFIIAFVTKVLVQKALFFKVSCILT